MKNFALDQRNLYGDKKFNDKWNQQMLSTTIKYIKTTNDLTRHYSKYLKVILAYYQIIMNVLYLFKLIALLFMIKQ